MNLPEFCKEYTRNNINYLVLSKFFYKNSSLQLIEAHHAEIIHSKLNITYTFLFQIFKV